MVNVSIIINPMKKIRIKTAKGFRMLSQAKAAEQIGISESHLSLLLRHKRKPGIAIYFKLKRAGIDLWGKK